MHPLSLFMSTNIILMFHIIPSSEWFRNTLRTIGRLYRFVPIQTVESYFYNNKRINNTCHITFDDGDRTLYDNAFPVLKEMGIPSTVFVSPRIIMEGENYWFQEINTIRRHLNDEIIKERISQLFECDSIVLKKYRLFSLFNSMCLKDINKIIDYIKKEDHIYTDYRYNISKDELHFMNKSDLIEFGAHTMRHPILRNEDNQTVEIEITESVQGLYDILGSQIKYFAYPNGDPIVDFGSLEKDILKNNNIKLAFATNKGYYSMVSDPFSIPRGNFSGTNQESRLHIGAELLLLPFWSIIRDIFRPGRTEANIERKERIEIAELGIF